MKPEEIVAAVVIVLVLVVFFVGFMAVFIYLFIKLISEADKAKGNIGQSFDRFTNAYMRANDEEREEVSGQIEGIFAPFIDTRHLEKWNTNLDKLREINEKRGKNQLSSPMTQKAEALRALESEYEEALRKNPEQRLALRMMYEEEKRKILES